MANEAWLFIDDHPFRKIRANDKDAEKGADYRCAGGNHNRPCHAKMILCQGEVESFFALASGAEHIANCRYDKRNARKRAITILDKQGKNYTLQSIFDMQRAKNSAPPPKGGGEEPRPDGGDWDDNDEDDADITLEDPDILRRPPRNIKELVSIFTALEPDDTLGGTLVADQFCTRDSVKKFQKNNGGLSIVCARLTYPPRGFRLQPGEFMLAIDGTLDDKVFILFRSDNYVLERLKNAKKKKIYILSEWSPLCGQFSNVYRASGNVTRHLIFIDNN